MLTFWGVQCVISVAVFIFWSIAFNTQHCEACVYILVNSIQCTTLQSVVLMIKACNMRLVCASPHWQAGVRRTNSRTWAWSSAPGIPRRNQLATMARERRKYGDDAGFPTFHKCVRRTYRKKKYYKLIKCLCEFLAFEILRADPTTATKMIQ